MTGRLFSLWWRGIVGLHVDLAAEHIILDYGDGQPIGLSGSRVAPVAVAAIASIYGAQALVGHPALALLRGEGPQHCQARFLPTAKSEA